MSTSQTGDQPTKGKRGEVSYYLKEGVVIARPAHNMRTQKGRTRANMASRTRMPNLNLCWRQLKIWLKDCYERPRPGTTDYSEFMSLNLQRTEVHLTKQEAEDQVQVADHFVVSHGSLPDPIEVRREGSWLLSDLRVGPLPKGLDTPMVDFVSNLITSNPGRLKRHDVLLFVRLRQRENIDTRQPRVSAAATRVELNSLYRNSLRHMLEGQDWQEGFSLDPGFLAHPYREGELVAWILLRPQPNGRPQVTTQSLYGDNRLLAEFTSQAHLDEAILSYGPIERR